MSWRHYGETPLPFLENSAIICGASTVNKWIIKRASWWRNQMETFSALLVLCEGNPPVSDGFPSPSQRPVTRSFDVFFDVRPDEWLSKHTRCWWFETPWCSLWRHCNGFAKSRLICAKNILPRDCHLTLLPRHGKPANYKETTGLPTYPTPRL